MESITEDEIKICVAKRSLIEPGQDDLAQIERAIEGLTRGNSRSNLETRV